MSHQVLRLMTGAFAALSLSHAVSADTQLKFERSDLADPTRAEAFYTSIAGAAHTECRAEHDVMSIYGPSVRRVAIERCVAEVIEAAVRFVNAPTLTALHNAHTSSAFTQSKIATRED